MFRNFLRTFIRNNLRHKLSFFVRVFGFVAGLASAVLLLAYVYHEYSFESCFRNSGRIYRISLTTQMAGKEVEFAPNVPALAPALKAVMPEIQSFVLINRDFPQIMMKSDLRENLLIKDVLRVDSSFFTIFDFPFVKGDALALARPDEIVLTESLAKRLFGDADALNKNVTVAGQKLLKVGAIIKDPPSNTHLKFQALISLVTFPDPPVWDDAHAITYVLTTPNTNRANFEKKIAAFSSSNGFIKDAEQKLGAKFRFDVMPISDIHLHSHRLNELSDNSSAGMLYVFMTVAIFFIVIAVFNYINIAIATSLTRIREIGMRKVFGGLAGQIRFQFFIESVIVIVLSFIPAALLAIFLLPAFSGILQQEIDLRILLNVKFIGLMALLLLVVIVGSSVYPCFYLSSFSPVEVFNKKLAIGKGAFLSVRQALIVLQLALSTGVIICTVIAMRQLNYVIAADVGFDRKNVLYMEVPDAGKGPYFRNELGRLSGVSMVAASNYSPAHYSTDEYSFEEENGKMTIYNFARMTFDNSFLKLIHVDIAEGRSFDSAMKTDYDHAFLVNEALVKFFGWKHPIGKKISSANYTKVGSVVGVMKDASLFSLHEKKIPVIASFSNGTAYDGEVMFVRYNNGDLPDLIARIKGLFAQAFGDVPFTFNFLDESYDHLYQSDERLKRIIEIGSCIMLFISCLGIYGLSSFIVIQRGREIGVRKILGATRPAILYLYVKDFFILATIAAIIVSPVAYYFSNKWLETFTSHAPMQVWIYIVAIGAMIGIVIFTTAFHALRLASTNPVKVIREEG